MKIKFFSLLSMLVCLGACGVPVQTQEGSIIFDGSNLPKKPKGEISSATDEKGRIQVDIGIHTTQPPYTLDVTPIPSVTRIPKGEVSTPSTPVTFLIDVNQQSNSMQLIAKGLKIGEKYDIASIQEENSPVRIYQVATEDKIGIVVPTPEKEAEYYFYEGGKKRYHIKIKKN